MDSFPLKKNKKKLLTYIIFQILLSYSTFKFWKIHKTKKYYCIWNKKCTKFCIDNTKGNHLKKNKILKIHISRCTYRYTRAIKEAIEIVAKNIVKNIDKENRSYSRSNVRLLGRPEGLDHISTERRQSVRVFYRGGERGCL